MNPFNRISKTLVLFSLLLGAASTCLNAQDYYGNGGGEWRRRPAKDTQTKDKDDAINTEPSGYISINFGFATPEGAFSTAIGSNYGGYALPGDVFHFSIGIPVQHSNFGVALMFGSYNNQYDLNKYSANNMETALYPDQNYYSESSILGGLFFTYPVGRLSIDCRLMGGALLCSLPEQAYGYNDVAGDTYLFDVQQSNATSLAFDAGIGARVLLLELGRRKVCAMVNVDYLYSNVSYSTAIVEQYTPYVNPNGVTYQTSGSMTGKLPIELLNITFGIGYQL